MSYLRYLCCPTHIVLRFCFVCRRVVYPILPNSLDCSFVITGIIIYSCFGQYLIQQRS